MMNIPPDKPITATLVALFAFCAWAVALFLWGG